MKYKISKPLSGLLMYIVYLPNVRWAPSHIWAISMRDWRTKSAR